MEAATNQLSLRLEPDRGGLPNLPEIRPMLSRPLAEPFDSPEHMFEPTWGGLRALAYVGPADRAGTGRVRVVAERADEVDVTNQLPELAGLSVRVAARSAILDGELVIVDNAGRADPSELEARLAGGRGRPVAFLAFDLVHLDGRSLLGTPLTKRRQLLRKVLRPGDEVVAVPAIRTEGRALFDAAVGQGIAGITARQRSSPYLPGIRSRLWRFIPAHPGVVGNSTPPDLATPASEPVLALISRLPLGLDEG
jgi:ATP-dependent DNA ligase